jgi:ribosome-binding protein aMBF1 (putative translation factor)
VSVLLCGCGKFECELCGEEKSGKKYEGEVMGRTVVYCEECKEQVDSIRDMFN